MIANDEYQIITKDIAGSRTKNRFMYEMCYGIKRIYDLYLNGKDFFIIFDYACDIEEGIDDCINFYQLKTSTSSYTLKRLLYHKENEKSILQTLVDLKRSSYVNKLCIVSNVKISKLQKSEKNVDLNNLDELSFVDLSEEDKKIVNKSVKWVNDNECFESLKYIVSELCMDKVTNSLVGYTTDFLDKLFPDSPSKSKYYQSCIINLVREKAIYEKDTISLNDTIQKKGIVRKDIEDLLEKYQNNLIDSCLPSYDYIDNKLHILNLTIKEEIDIKSDYTRYFSCGYLKESIKAMCSEIRSMAQSDCPNLNYCDAIKYIVENFKYDTSYLISSKYLFAIVALK